MTVSVGIVAYKLGASPVTGTGLSWSIADLDKALTGPIAAIVFDDSGTADLNALLSGLPDTEFDSKAVKEILSNSKAPEDWRVGEALAECYLVSVAERHKNDKEKTVRFMTRLVSSSFS
jgi:hypothetical protein